MKRLFMILTSLLIAIILFVAHKSYYVLSCQKIVENISYDVEFRKKQCEVTGSRKECYEANNKLLKKELKEKGCLR